MKREIKFRAYSHDTKKMYPYAIVWFNWELWVHKNEVHNWEWKNIWCGNDEGIVDYNYELMQFTWLLDKNWNEIFEWDVWYIWSIVAPANWEIKCKVVFREWSFALEWLNENRLWYLNELERNQFYFKVIWNIYEDSNLLNNQ